MWGYFCSRKTSLNFISTMNASEKYTLFISWLPDAQTVHPYIIV